MSLFIQPAQQKIYRPGKISTNCHIEAFHHFHDLNFTDEHQILLIGGDDGPSVIETYTPFGSSRSCTTPTALPLDTYRPIPIVVRDGFLICWGPPNENCFKYARETNSLEVYPQNFTQERRDWMASIQLGENKVLILEGKIEWVLQNSTLVYDNGVFTSGPELPEPLSNV